MRIGVTALQGGFIEHIRALQSLDAEPFEIRKRSDLGSIDGLVLPGGESTTMGKLLKDLDLFLPLQSMIREGLPVFGTCAGMILLARTMIGGDESHFGLMNIAVKRNAYGRQLGSFATEADFEGIGAIPMTFIRAPYIESVGSGVQILSTVDHHIVAAREKNMLVTAYHPELTADTRVHQYFIEQIH
jgi:5'-phosphate synthase pdxT subunit